LRFRPGRSVAGACLALALLTAGCAKKAPAPPRDATGFGGWEEIRIGTDAWFHGLHFVDGENGWIVGSSPFVAGGIVGRTEDGGKTWRYVSGVTKGGPTSGLAAVHGFDRMRACAVGSGAYVTFDGGASWQPAGQEHALRYLAALDFPGGGEEGWAAGAGGVFHTQDAGMKWTQRDTDREAPIGSISPRAIRFLDAQNGFISGQYGQLWRTRDGGRTWARVTLNFPSRPGAPPPTLAGMAFESATRGWLVGDGGTVLKTSDGGGAWDVVDVGAKNAILSAITFAGKDGWIVGYLPDGAARSVVHRTRDGGETWTLERTLDGEELRAVQALDPGTAWAVGDRVRTEPQRMLRRRPPGR
jgi:photosystem II stability/assembly factor-like uncharacterized protein